MRAGKGRAIKICYDLMNRLIINWFELCENLCEKNFPKSSKIGKNRKIRGKLYYANSVVCNNLRRLGNSDPAGIIKRFEERMPDFFQQVPYEFKDELLNFLNRQMSVARGLKEGKSEIQLLRERRQASTQSD